MSYIYMYIYVYNCNITLFATELSTSIIVIADSHWLRVLRSGSAAARLLKLWVCFPPAEWMFVVSVVCCQVQVLATSRSLIQRSLTDCVAS